MAALTDVQREALLQKDGQTYQLMEQTRHVLERPDLYIGSVEQDVYRLFVAEPDAENKKVGHRLVERDVRISQGVYKIYDEIQVNASDAVVDAIHKRQTDSSVVPPTRIDVKLQGNTIEVTNWGESIPVALHPEHKVWIPTMIFGTLLTSANYDDSKERVTGGRNGIGAKATNLFSTSFEIEVVDHRRQKKLTQRWTQNMSVAEPPKVTSCTKKPYTRVRFTPDYQRFGMTVDGQPGMNPDLRACIRKRVLDLAGCTPSSIKVYLDGKRLGIQNFKQYAEIYTASVCDESQIRQATQGKKPKLIGYRPNDRWEIWVTEAPNHQFRQVSFVNGVCTSRGGRHVDYLGNRIAKAVAAKLNSMRGVSGLKPAHVKSHLSLFVNCQIVNPAFDTQSKECLTTPMTKFGSACVVADQAWETFIDKVAKGPVGQLARAYKTFASTNLLKKSDGTRAVSLRDIPKLHDANLAGTRRSVECTLIVTEGDSAKSSVLSAMEVLGRQKYGVFPLRGKLLNVRDATLSQLLQNTEIHQLKKILGLKQDTVYTSLRPLRYGSVMCLCDSDVDGSHIQGLFLNFIAFYWPELIKLGFVCSMYTPRVRVFRGPRCVHEFYSDQEYEVWWDTVKDDPATKRLKVKAYKGLGTSTAAEFKHYFRQNRRVVFQMDSKASEALTLAFGPNAAPRKPWVQTRKPALDLTKTLLPVTEFVHTGLVHYSIASNERSLAGFDGLVPVQRKILWAMLDRNVTEEVKIFELAGMISSRAKYHHGDSSIQGAIFGLCRNFVGTNNINLLYPGGQVGSRRQGGKDAAQGRYVSSRLEPVTKLLLQATDNPLLTPTEVDGKQVEPEVFLPVLPLVLVNGASGIGTGFSTSVPRYAPDQLISWLRQMIAMAGQGQDPQVVLDAIQPDLQPHFRGFKGSVLLTTKPCNPWITQGVFVRTANPRTVVVTEIPVGVWKEDYERDLDKAADPENKGFLQAWQRLDGDDTDTVRLEVTVTPAFFAAHQVDNQLPDQVWYKWLKLTNSTSVRTSNMHLYDPLGNVVQFPRAKNILLAFFRWRLLYYRQRRAYLLGTLQQQIDKADQQIKFIEAVTSLALVLYPNRTDKQIHADMLEAKFTGDPTCQPIALRRVTDAEIAACFADQVKDAAIYAQYQPGPPGPPGPSGSSRSAEQKTTPDFSYLLDMPVRSLTTAKMQRLEAKRQQLQEQKNLLSSQDAYILWDQDLQALSTHLSSQPSSSDNPKSAKVRLAAEVDGVSATPVRKKLASRQ